MDSGPDSILLELLVILILILLNAFLAISETAIISTNKSKLHTLEEQDNKTAHLLLTLSQEPNKFLATIQAGITLVGFFVSAFAATTIANHLTPTLQKYNITASKQVSIIIVTLLLAFITLVFGDLLPKRIALERSEQLAIFSVRPFIFISKLISPFVKLAAIVANLLVRLVGIKSDNFEEKMSEEEIRSMIEVGEENGVINKIEKTMIDGIFKFDDTIAKEIMIPRINVFAIDIETPIDELVDSVLEEQYSRIPVYENDIDNIIGVLYMKDIFMSMRKNTLNTSIIRNLLRPANFVPETKNIDTLFTELKSTKNHIVLLIDEYGGFSGIVTIEDIIEEVMGNIFDEYDDFENNIKKIDADTYMVNGLAPIDEFNDYFDLDLQSENYDTIGGFVLDLIGTVPSTDNLESVEYENIIFKIEKVDDKRIESIKVGFTQES